MFIDKFKQKDREEIAYVTMTFHFERPTGFTYKTGQFGDYALMSPSETDTEGNLPGFFLRSASYESDIVFENRMRESVFKRDLKMTDIFIELSLDVPYGLFTLQNDTRISAIFLSSDIGITPVKSEVIFNHPRDFAKKHFGKLMFVQTVGPLDMLRRLKEWKQDCGFRVISINNECRILDDLRIKKFDLHRCLDVFISFFEVGTCKTNPDILSLEMSIPRAPPEGCVYYYDSLMRVQSTQ